GLGDADGGPEGATFASARIGVRAQIQHLKAYASVEPLVQELVDPRFRFISRGVAPLVNQLSGRWAADPQYGEKIMSQVRRLYESAGLL
ncbi:MAG: cell wall hydrolase, partial [Cyanobacteria bacterium J06659_2]